MNQQETPQELPNLQEKWSTENPMEPGLRSQQSENIQEAQRSEHDAINEIYSNVKSIPSYSSKILEFLRKDETSSLHKRIRRNFRRRKVMAFYPYDICMADLAFFTGPGMSKANHGYKYVLVFIDVFSKMCFVESMKDKQGVTTLIAFENIFRRLPQIPHHIVTDVGTEFYNSHVNKLFYENDVNHYSIRGTHKAAVAERMIRTLKGRIEKYLWRNKTKRYIDVIQDIVDNYNKSPHRSIGMAPVDVNDLNRKQVFKKLYKNFNRHSEPRLDVGDRVRIAKLKTIFDKGYTRRWSLELYTIISAKSRDGVDYYRIKDQNGNVLPRQRYYYELNLVYRRDETGPLDSQES